MKTHFDHLRDHIPDLGSRTILDIGSGRGAFVVDAAVRGARVTGIEPYEGYRVETADRAQAKQVSVNVVAGSAEQLPFADASFGFINMGEVVEHVEDPYRALAEAHRTLASGGSAYVSIPNRFGFRDPHYHLYAINWMPRSWAEAVIMGLGMTKKSTPETGRQRLSDMHYMTYGSACRLLREIGFAVSDIRELKIRARVPAALLPFALSAYRWLRVCYFDTFHLLLRKV